MERKPYVRWFLWGMPLGLANVLPGLSAGTIGLLLGIYQELIDAIKSIRLELLVPVGLGLVVSILLGARATVWLLEAFPVQTTACLVGLVLASAWVALQTIDGRGQPWVWPVGLVGFVAVFWMTGIEHSAIALGEHYILSMVIAGALASSAMVLPGVSGATVLVALGLYDTALEAVVALNWRLLLPLGLGVVAGLLGLAWVLGYLLKRYPRVSMALLIGMILGTVPMMVLPIFGWGILPWVCLGFGLVAFVDGVVN